MVVTGCHGRGTHRCIQLRRSSKPILIAARRSPLSRAQAGLIGASLAAANKGLKVEYVWIQTRGDQTAGPLIDIGGKGLFTSELEKALYERIADIAVHSLKDVPATTAVSGGGEGLIIAAVPRRADARDCLISRDLTNIADLPHNASVGTSSPRRAAQLKSIRPDLNIQPLRGNVETRLRAVREESRFDATILAVAGLQRLGLGNEAACPVEPAVLLPAAGQGALALQCRPDDHTTITRCLPLNHTSSAASVTAERLIVAGLEGDCQAAIAAYAEPDLTSEPDGVRLRAQVLARDGRENALVDLRGRFPDLRSLAQSALKQLCAAGAKQLLRPAD